MTQNTTSYISIPNKLIYDTKINTKAKYLYIILKKHAINNKVNINYENIMNNLEWSDKRTFKKYLEILKDNNYISYDFTRIVYYLPLKIELIFSKPFVMIARSIVEKILILNISKSYKTTDSKSTHKRTDSFFKEKGLIYLFFIEHLFNIQLGYSFPSRKELTDILKITNKELSHIIKQYHKNHLCEYCQGEILEGSESSATGIRRTRNRYLPNNILSNGKYRYYNHKPKDYFFK